MSNIELFILALSLSMDSFAVSIVVGMSYKGKSTLKYTEPGFYFGAFQGLMPLFGFFAASLFIDRIMLIKYFIAFIILLIIGGKMVWDSFATKTDKMHVNPIKMLLLATATSIDALAVGITLALLEVNIFKASLVIGITTFCVSTAGAFLGNFFSTKLKKIALFIGGIVLILLANKFLL